jgi:hypothetical protein
MRAELKVGFRGLAEVYMSKVTMNRPRSIEVRDTCLKMMHVPHGMHARPIRVCLDSWPDMTRGHVRILSVTLRMFCGDTSHGEMWHTHVVSMLVFMCAGGVRFICMYMFVCVSARDAEWFL